MSTTFDRRGFLGRSLVASAALASTAPMFVQALTNAAGAADQGGLRTARHGRGGYGPLSPKQPLSVGPGSIRTSSGSHYRRASSTASSASAAA